jgi:type I restriction enzyme S subunit
MTNNMEWSSAKLLEIVEAKKGKKPLVLTDKPQQDDVPYIDIEAFEKGVVNRYTSDKNVPISNINRDILVVWDGARAGLVGKASGAVGSTLMKLTPKNVNGDYLFLFLISKYKEINKNPRGTGIPHVNPDIFWQIEVPLPGQKEQQVIASKINNLLPSIEKNARKIIKIKNLLRKLRQAILTAAVTGKLTEDWREKNQESVNLSATLKRHIFIPVGEFEYEVPETWMLTALGNFADCSRGKFSIRPRNDPRYYGGNHPFIQIGDLPKEGGLITSHTQTLNEAGLKVSKLFNQGTVAIAIVGATIGNTGILNYDMSFPDSLVGIDSGSQIGNKYIDYYLRARKLFIRGESYAGGGQPNINLEVLNNYPFPLPPSSEQKEIVDRLDNYFTIIEEIEKQIENAETKVSKLTQAVLTKSFKANDIE